MKGRCSSVGTACSTGTVAWCAGARELARQADGALRCEVCGFDFVRQYGSLAGGCIECHHRVALLDWPTPAATQSLPGHSCTGRHPPGILLHGSGVAGMESTS